MKNIIAKFSNWLGIIQLKEALNKLPQKDKELFLYLYRLNRQKYLLTDGRLNKIAPVHLLSS